jgi:hypothetical protein
MTREDAAIGSDLQSRPPRPFATADGSPASATATTKAAFAPNSLASAGSRSSDRA